ncbi:ABC transporter substrate-binding protein [Mesobacillus stamsii]|uniref:Multiple sugar transport system substrate-binding protein n=1 Tax=Mesobacillus stamsii TaxID=225347 RepID=A0ABU0G0P6_9BACI|nr:ABC transporter substrate-binding protein [Mesobacillus stamsii]MDQ0415772.1 multiple sugar transport system substrate-binding protein [Mesobacillus stamsii]
MKKIAAFALATSLMVGLSACSSSSEKTDNAKGGNEITLAVWGSSPAETKALEATIDSFEKASGKNVKVEVIQDNFQDALTARFAAKNAPDVFYMEAYAAPKFIKSGVLADISNEAKNQEDFYEPLIDSFKGEDGKLYALPKDYSTLSLYVNTDLLTKAGFKVEDIPSDWNGLLEFSEKVQAKLDKGQAAMVFDNTMARHLSAMIASDLNPVTEDGKADFTSSPEAISYLESLVEGQDKGYLANPKTDLGVDWAGAAFGANKAVFMIEGNWVLSALKTDYSDVKYQVFPAPKVNGKEQTMTFTVGYAIAKDSENKETAVEFINYMTGDGLKQWSEGSGTLPSRISTSEEMKVNEDPVLKAHVEGAEYGTVWSSGVNLPVISQAFDNQFMAALNGDKSVEQAMKDAEQEANDEIARQE